MVLVERVDSGRRFAVGLRQRSIPATGWHDAPDATLDCAFPGVPLEMLLIDWYHAGYIPLLPLYGKHHDPRQTISYLSYLTIPALVIAETSLPLLPL